MFFLCVGTMEDVDNVTDEEGNHAQEHITQGIIEDGQRQRYALDNPR